MIDRNKVFYFLSPLANKIPLNEFIQVEHEPISLTKKEKQTKHKHNALVLQKYPGRNYNISLL